MRRRYDTSDRDPPLNMLSQLLMAARAPDPGDPDPTPDDQAWVYASSVNRWTNGWHILETHGYIDMQQVAGNVSANDDEFIEIPEPDWAIRLTGKGLNYALEANTTDVARKVRAAEKREDDQREAQGRYAATDGFGMF